MRLSLLVSLAAVAVQVSSGTCQEKKQAAEPNLKIVKLDDFERTVKAERGKVVVVYVWANYDVVSKTSFPSVVEWHEKHAKDGLVVISLSVDRIPLDYEDGMLRFLKTKRAVFRNLVLDAPPEVWQEKLVSAEPGLLIFDRTSKRIPFDLLDGENIVAPFNAAGKLLTKLIDSK